MRRAVVRWFGQAVAAVGDLMNRPWSLFFALLAVNAVALPYRGVVHDSQLYAVQVMNRVENGAYGDDLFFRYGSQDKYSLFSLAAAPLVRVLGLQNAFFLLYIVFNSLLLLAAQRLLTTLFKDRRVVGLSLLLLATTPLSYSGCATLVVNENFVTPRILAIALSVFALDQMFKRRYKTVFLLLAGAGLMHPLMAFGAALAFAGWWAVERFGWRRTLIACSVLGVAVAAVLAWRPLGTRVLGPLDDEWRDYARRAVPMNFPSEWLFLDWLHLGAGLLLTFLLGFSPCESPEDRRIARFALVIGGVSAAAVVGTFLAAWLPYALPLQGQPYRALWLLRLMQAPFGLQLAVNLWRQQDGRGKLPALGVAAYFAAVYFAPLEFVVMALAALAVAGFYYQAFSSTPRATDSLPRSLAVGIVLGAGFWAALRLVSMLAIMVPVLRVTNPTQYSSLVFACLGFVGWAAVGLAAAWLAARVLGTGWRLCAAAGGTCLALQVAALIVLNVYEVPARPTSDVQFVGRFLEERREGDRLPTLYCSVAEASDVWLIAHAKSYFSRPQLNGNVFHRQTAVEGQRRALLLKRFEQERLRRYLPFVPDDLKRNQEELFETPLDAAPPTLDDLAAVCQEDGVDYVAVPEAFDAPCVADNGRIYIYDCRQVRAALGRPTSAVAQVVAEKRPGDSIAAARP